MGFLSKGNSDGSLISQLGCNPARFRVASRCRIQLPSQRVHSPASGHDVGDTLLRAECARDALPLAGALECFVPISGLGEGVGSIAQVDGDPDAVANAATDVLREQIERDSLLGLSRPLAVNASVGLHERQGLLVADLLGDPLRLLEAGKRLGQLAALLEQHAAFGD